MRKVCLLFSLLILSIGFLTAQDSLWVRKYDFGAFNQYDLRNSSINAVSTQRALQDAFRLGIQPHINNEKLGNVSYGVYSFATTFLTMLWSHEMGHYLRARQVGGEFRIHNGSLPIPYTTMHLPEDINLVDEALSVTAGFEVNVMNARQIQREFLSQNGIYNEDLSFAFANRIMYPLYTSIIVPRDPAERDTWINTAGDPVHVVLPVFENYSNGEVFMADSTVNPDLVDFYNHSALFGFFFNFADPQFYRELGAAFGKKKIRQPIFLVGDHHTGWTYGTSFSVSPLGYELYLNNYVHLAGQQFTVYVKYGNPYKNNGLGLGWNNIIDGDKINLSANIDLWDQDLFGTGISGEACAHFKFSEKFGAFAIAGYKTEGYVLGKQLDEGMNVGIGLSYYGRY